MNNPKIRGLITVQFVLILAIGVACGSKEEYSPIVKEDGLIQNPAQGFLQDENPPVEFELIDTFDLSGIDDPVIGDISYLQIDAEGNFYFIDRRSNKLVSTDSEGNLRWTTGQGGNGPGDFENPFGLELHQEKLFVANIMGTRLDAFDKEGNFIKSYDMPKDIRYAMLRGIRDDGLILMQSANFGTVGAMAHVMELTDSLRVRQNVNIKETEDEKYSMATVMGSLKMQDEGFVYSFNTRYAHQFYDYEGNLKLEVQRDFDGVVGPGIYAEGGRVSLYGLGEISSPVYLDNGQYLVQVRYPVNIDDPNEYARRAATGETAEPVYEIFMDVYSADHELLYTFDDSKFVEELGGLTVRDQEGFYYSVFGDGLMIKKFRVEM
ncbi:hypothetical protein [Gracilimonas mengyeensis]|uniref:6-bladed beta-propeller protein n=1 Tax=Gracilimonas mengyeensis TaxID=1302730 RepID=A0A521B5Y1_9BACT|nr:hypothetical protein [Gracilimonas mengyeensis]SMO42475.1 hypothetical protein SAMN06265219_10243 [Gracilimonas mengyeensis]